VTRRVSRSRRRTRRCVAVHVAFESKGLKPGYHITGSRVGTRRLSSYGSTGFNLDSPADEVVLLRGECLAGGAFFFSPAAPPPKGDLAASLAFSFVVLVFPLGMLDTMGFFPPPLPPPPPPSSSGASGSISSSVTSSATCSHPVEKSLSQSKEAMRCTKSFATNVVRIASQSSLPFPARRREGYFFA
jgi:hypothetical protein